MPTTTYPLSWLDPTTGEPESDPIHTLACEACGFDPEGAEAAAILIADSSAVEAIERSGNKAPGCDEQGNLDHGAIYAVTQTHGGSYACLVWVRDGVAKRV